MGGTGLEPVTPSLSSYSGHDNRRRRRTTNGRNHAGFSLLPARWTAWLRGSVLGRLGQEWATSGGRPEGRVRPRPPTWRVSRKLAQERASRSQPYA
jgi:hypothetical protein